MDVTYPINKAKWTKLKNVEPTHLGVIYEIHPEDYTRKDLKFVYGIPSFDNNPLFLQLSQQQGTDYIQTCLMTGYTDWPNIRVRPLSAGTKVTLTLITR